jgi:hypothetical protein
MYYLSGVFYQEPRDYVHIPINHAKGPVLDSENGDRVWGFYPLP